jgi:hypothetical protein
VRGGRGSSAGYVIASCELLDSLFDPSCEPLESLLDVSEPFDNLLESDCSDCKTSKQNIKTIEERA